MPERMRVLAVRLDAMGDVLMTTPALRALKHGLAAHVTLLTSPSGAGVARFVPEVDEVLVYEAPWMKATPRRPDPGPDEELIARVRHGAHDAAVVFTVYSQNPLPAALLCYLAGVPVRAAHCRENPYQLLTHWVKDLEPETMLRHEVRRQLDLVAELGAHTDDERLSFAVAADDARVIAQWLRERGLGGRPWVVVHPGATAASRRYPPEAFAVVARALVRDLGWDVVLTGSADERALVAAIREAAGVPVHDAAGAFGLGAFAALVLAAPLVVSNNTGTVHVAAAVGTPVVDLYALTNPQHTPWRVPNRVLFHDVSCKWCFRSVCPLGTNDCLRGVSPEAVVAAARELMGGTACTRWDSMRRFTTAPPAS